MANQRKRTTSAKKPPAQEGLVPGPGRSDAAFHAEILRDGDTPPEQIEAHRAALRARAVPEAQIERIFPESMREAPTVKPHRWAVSVLFEGADGTRSEGTFHVQATSEAEATTRAEEGLRQRGVVVVEIRRVQPVVQWPSPLEPR